MSLEITPLIITGINGLGWIGFIVYQYFNSRSLIRKKHYYESKFEIYSKLYALIVKCFRNIKIMDAAKYGNSYQDYARLDFEQLFEKNKIKIGFQNNFFNDFDSERIDKAIVDWKKYRIECFEVPDAFNGLSNFKIYLDENILFLSEEIEKESQIAVKKLDGACKITRRMVLNGTLSSADQSKLDELETEIPRSIENIKNMMTQELGR